MSGMNRLKHSEFVYYLALPLIWLYTYPKWSSEVECIGFQKCTPTGSWLRSIAVVLGYVGGVFLVVGFMIMGSLRFRRILKEYIEMMYIGIGMAGLSVVMGLAGRVLYMMSQWLAEGRGFKYDGLDNVASWDENGRRVTYDREQLKKELKK